MIILAITDSSRITDLLEKMSRNRNDLVVVGDIHRGAEALKSMKPDIIIIQNHLSGLSADILLKHIKSRLDGHDCRFLLVSTPDALEPETKAAVAGIIDPSKTDAELQTDLEKLTAAQLPKNRLPQEEVVTSRAEVLFKELSRDESIASSKTAATQATKNDDKKKSATEKQQTPDDLPKDKTAASANLNRFTPPRKNLIITDAEQPPPWYRHKWAGILLAVLLVALAITSYQYKSDNDSNKPVAKPKHAVKKTKQAENLAKNSDKAIKNIAEAPKETKNVTDKTTIRPDKLFSFIPAANSDKNYAKNHPGWERYLGETCEYRIFRGEDKLIKSVQILDKSGAGIQDAFSRTILKETADTNSLSAVTSETKEGYEIKRGKAGNLDVIQYLDEQNKQIHGIVIVWP